MADPQRLKRAAIRGWRVGCCAVGISLVLAAQAFAVTVTVTTSDGVQGGNLTLTMGLRREATDPVVTGAQTDVIFDTTQIQITGACSNNGSACQGSAECGDGTCRLPCVNAPQVKEQDFTANLPDTPPDVPPKKRLRVAVFAFQNPAVTYDTGDLVTCAFQVRSDAQPGEAVRLDYDPARLSASDANTDPIPNVLVEVVPGVIRQATPTPTLTTTPTPTPTIPCFVDRDCPRGQVCNPATRVCEPAPTPTPTITCEKDEDCPEGTKCISNICRDIRTPTPTPTPLPPCTVDTDCQLGYHCRAKVCVPIRECDDADPVLDRTNCRGVREACANGTCECGGDCNVDGFVLGNETTRMVCVLSGQCELSDCAAGDFNGDGQITGNEVCAAVTNLGLGCPAEGQPLVGQDRSNEIRNLDIGPGSGFPGDTVTISVNLGGGGDVATAQLDVIFDTAVLDIPDPTTDCRVDPRISASDTAFTFLPQTPNTPEGKARLRLFVGDVNLCRDGLSFPPRAFDVGPLLSCTFRIRPNAPAGDSALTAERLNVGDPHGNEFGTASTAGTVSVLSLTPTVPATETPTETPPPTPPTLTPTATPTATNTGTPPTATNTATPTNTGTTPSANTPTPTATGGTPPPTRTNTPRPTVTGTPRPSSGGGGGGCSIATADAPDHATLLWLGLPMALFVWRRRG